MKNERYQRQEILEGFGVAAQELLSKASVLVIGAGGLGCPALQYLAGAGIGKLGIIDHDRISLSNLHRQVLYSTADIGRLKVDIAAQHLAALNPEISINKYPVRLDANNIIELFEKYDYILDGTDNFESRYLINDACILLNKPLVFAAVSGFEGQLAIFGVEDQYGQKTNYRDIFPIPPGEGEIPNCAENGVLGVLPGIIGIMQAAEAIKLITRIGQPLVNSILTYNLLQQKGYEISIIPSPAGSYHLPSSAAELIQIHQTKEEEIEEIDAAKLAKLAADGQALLIDVRETTELPALDLPNIVKIPMSAIDGLLALEIDQPHIVLICQHGIRSMAAAALLREKYSNTKKIYSLKGGIARYPYFYSLTR
ncbi:HesA/MoeB/ThiF family protein [Pedobacter sandarakinus]|uniref:HesA/MoeB/ThiF family protein n=1 Tax=Pedobacter sandarakinus TaxID=353156 RepID=UPI002245430E|nr:HesA/MoeB/ThiF family protein [Pedobacter sandarakinus]MCX2575303.1 HesA/MoeB/ThiF family protein [Pedobacter sandarakinus]